MKTYLKLPDGARFELLPPNKIPLHAAIKVQKETGLGPMALQARLVTTAAAMVKLAPIMEKLQAAEDDADRAALVEEFNREAAESDLDVLAFGAQVWASRLTAGERIGFEEACSFALHELVREDVAEDGDEPVDEAAA